MNFISKLIYIFAIVSAPLSAAEFTICSYNCGGLSDHYDYIRAVCMHKLVQQRHDAEPESMAQLEKIETAALKILFAEDREAQQEWDEGDYAALFDELTASPDAKKSPNQKWHQLSEQIVTTYQERPVVIYDEEINQILGEHVKDLTRKTAAHVSNASIDVARRIMATRIFEHELKYDIIALQEADYLDSSVFPEHYGVLFAKTAHSVDGLAWNKDRFELLEELGNVGRGFAALFCDLETGKTLLVVSGHLTGCNPFRIVGSDSASGDKELLAILDLLENHDADIKVIGMDSNVTATHPRLRLLKEAGFTVDCEKFLEPTCTNPWQVLNTRIDWIAVQSATVSNIPVLGVGLNSPQTNMSDHKPIAARIKY